jgi:hypothetical protein
MIYNTPHTIGLPQFQFTPTTPAPYGVTQPMYELQPKQVPKLISEFSTEEIFEELRRRLK